VGASWRMILAFRGSVIHLSHERLSRVTPFASIPIRNGTCEFSLSDWLISITFRACLPRMSPRKSLARDETGGPLQFRKRLVMLEIEPKYIQNNSRRHPSMRLVVTHKIFAACWPAVFLLQLLIGTLVPRAMAQANVRGQWSTLPNLAPINPIHAALLPNGKVLIVAGSGNCPPSQSGCPAGAPRSL
jgi:hypothetical protein